MLAIISSINPIDLRTLIENNDSLAMIDYLETLAVRIDDYVLWKYNEDIRENYDTTLPLASVATGLMLFAKEQGYIVVNGEIIDPSGRIDPYECFMDILGDLIGIGVIVQLYNEFAAGEATIGTIKKFLKSSLKRIGIGITIGLAILNLIFCLT